MRIHSLTTRFVLTLLLSTAVPFLVFAHFVRSELRVRLEQNVRTLLSGAADGLASRIRNRIEQLEGECSLFRSAAERALVGTPAIADFRDEVDLSPSFHTEYHLVALIDAEGRVLTVVDSLEQDGPTAAARAASRPANVRDTEWFRALLDVSGGPAQFWLDRHLSPFLFRDPTQISRDPGDYSFGLAFAVHGRERTLGAVLALKRWSSIQAELDTRAEQLRIDLPSVEAAICDDHDLVIAHTDRARYGERFAAFDAAGHDAPHDYVAFLRENGELWHLGSQELTAFGDAASWRVLTAASDRDLFAVSRRFGDLLLLVTAIVAAILVVWAWFASRAILRPVRRLVEATGSVAAGDFAARVETRGRDELADLGRAFNAMAAEVAASREQLRDAARQSAWAEMARQVAHEIKNPLTPMRMSAQLLLRARQQGDPRLPELVDRLARTVTEQTDALARIATDFRRFAGEPAREVRVVAVRDLLADVEQDFAATVESGVALRFGNQTGDASVAIDRHELRRVFLNLVQNALDAAGADGEVEVIATDDPNSPANIVFSVVDNGPGIDPSVRERLFEPYFTTRSAGTGLGLAICRRIVEAHGGSIALGVSDPGRTEFRFVLPRAAPTAG